MKKAYSKPVATKIAFSYQEQIVASQAPGTQLADSWHCRNEGARDQMIRHACGRIDLSVQKVGRLNTEWMFHGLAIGSHTS